MWSVSIIMILDVVAVFPLNFNGHFPGGLGLASTRMFSFWILLELRIMEVVTTGAVRDAKPQSYRHHQQTNTKLFTGWMPFLSPNQQCQSTEEKLLWLCWRWTICIVCCVSCRRQWSNAHYSVWRTFTWDRAALLLRCWSSVFSVRTCWHSLASLTALPADDLRCCLLTLPRSGNTSVNVASAKNRLNFDKALRILGLITSFSLVIYKDEHYKWKSRDAFDN